MLRLLVMIAVSLAPLAVHGDDEVADEVRRLVEKLDARSLADRKQAEEDIVALGTKALAHLPRSTRRLSAEARDRLARIRKLLERQHAKQSIAPSLVTLASDKSSFGLALKKFADQTGNSVYLPGGEGPDISAKLDKAPYWQSLDGLLDQAGMTIYPFADSKGYRAEPRVDTLRPRAERAAYSGAFRFEPTMLRVESDLRQKAGRSLHLKLHTSWEPRLAPIAIGLKPKSLTAVDDDGNAVLIDPATSASAVAVRARTMASDLDIVLVPPPRTVRSIAKLSGSIGVLMPTSRVRFEFDDLSSARARRERIGSVSVVLDEVRKIDDLWKVSIRVQFKDAASGLESHLDWESKDQAFAVGADGKKLPPARREMQKQGDEVTWSYWFRVPGKIDDHRLVYDVPSDIVELTVPFELKDLQLP